jgi:hypothetical protein
MVLLQVAMRFKAVENAEDNATQAWLDLKKYQINSTML